MAKQTTRQVELAVAYYNSEGDRGDWSASHYVDIPADTPEDDISEVAIEKFYDELPANHDVSHVWLYCYDDVDDNIEDIEED